MFLQVKRSKIVLHRSIFCFPSSSSVLEVNHILNDVDVLDDRLGASEDDAHGRDVRPPLGARKITCAADDRQRPVRLEGVVSSLQRERPRVLLRLHLVV